MNNIFDLAYLFDLNPNTFQYRDLAIMVAILLLVFFALLVYLLKKRREYIKINKEQRFVLQYHAKIGLAISIGLLLAIVMRILDVAVLSMRAIPIVLSSLLLIISVVGGLRSYALRDKPMLLEENADEYAKYLPKKKKK